jgi:conjugative relaxase-like TrwC/TraI family protein
MLRVRTLHASSAAATAAYYAQYLTAAPGEEPGVWAGRQAHDLGLSGPVTVEALESLLSGHDPVTGATLGRELLDRFTADGRVIKAVSGFDATFSAPKSLSVWWALTGDDRLLDAHDAAVSVALEHLERFGSTTRIRRDGGRLHPETGGLTVASFRQTTSRADDPQIHTHAVISAKVQTPDGRWLALDARFLKRQQRMLGGLYQSTLRSELTARYGVSWLPIVNGQAELAGVPDELLAVFSKRASQVDAALDEKLVDFRDRHGRDPTRWERAALTREAAVDTRAHKSGAGSGDLRWRWLTEAVEHGWTRRRFNDVIAEHRADSPASRVTVEQIVDRLSVGGSTWARADVLRTICDLAPPMPGMSAQRWTEVLERAVDQVLGECVNLDPDGSGSRRGADGRSVWIEPVAPQFSSEQILVEEEHILTWSLDAHETSEAPSATVDATGLDVMQADAAEAVAGDKPLVLVVGPAGAGKTRTLARAVDDLQRHGRVVFGLAPTAKAARTLQRDAHVESDTVAKLLHEWSRPDRPPGDRWRLPAGATVLVDETGMVGTASLHRLATLAERHRWRLVLVGDPRQLQAVGRGGMFHQLCRTGPVHELQQIHRFTHRWEAAASLQLRAGDPAALDAYLAHDRIVAGRFEQHAATIADQWIEANRRGETVAITAATNDHVDELNRRIQLARVKRGEIDPCEHVRIAGHDVACVGDVIATRRNNRQLTTSTGEPVRNRDLWTVTARHGDGSITVAHRGGHGTVTLAGDYVRDVRLGYAATEHGTQSDTVTIGINLASTATGRRGLYVGASRGRERNTIHVITDSDELDEARDVLEAVLASDRADIPAITQRQTLAELVADRPPPAQPPQQPPGPRAVISASWAAVEAWARDQLDTAREAIHTSDQQRQELDERKAALGRATAAFEPHRAALTAAERTSRHARDAVAHAKQRLDNSRLRDRRSARSELIAAEQALEAAANNLNRIQPTAGVLRDEYVEAVARHQSARRAMVPTEILDQWNDYRGRAEQLEQLLDSLDAWKRWALGHDVPPERLSESAAVINRFADSQQHHQVTGIAAAIGGWSHHAGLDLPEQTPTPQQPSPSLARGLGLEL